jgi:ribosomal protein S18 acetylase RimI-like enzyme
LIRHYRPDDRAWVTEVAAEVYGDLGNYGAIVPPWLDHPGVLGWLEEKEIEPPPGNSSSEFEEANGTICRRGFVLLGFYELAESPRTFVAELVALAVAPRHQRQGVGRALLHHAIRVAELADRRIGVSEMRLTMAEENEAGRRLYLSTGFDFLEGDFGSYDGGQRAVRMVRSLAWKNPLPQPEPEM